MQLGSHHPIWLALLSLLCCIFNIYMCVCVCTGTRIAKGRGERESRSSSWWSCGCCSSRKKGKSSKSGGSSSKGGSSSSGSGIRWSKIIFHLLTMLAITFGVGYGTWQQQYTMSIFLACPAPLRVSSPQRSWCRFYLPTEHPHLYILLIYIYIYILHGVV